jgi:AraC family transcriptional activator of pobA
MEENVVLLDQFKHHHSLPISVNEDCAIPLPEDVLVKLFRPHRLSFYYFAFMHQGTASFMADAKKITVSDGQLVFGVPNQVFTNLPYNTSDNHYHLSFDESTLALLPNAYAFLLNPLHSNTITFDPEARLRVKAVFSMLFKLLHSPGKQQKADIILAHLNTLLTEFNNAYFEHTAQGAVSNSKLSKFVAFKLAVESHLTEDHEVQAIAEKLSMNTSTLYGIVKEFSGVSPKEWITNRLIVEAQRKLQYSTRSVKELAYELGFNDPDYFSRLFKKTTGKSVSKFLAESRDLSRK